jgi:4-alpha-glucanotransferase
MRASGILLHITSLPSPYGIGDFGPNAYRFADFLHDAGQTLWQILPLTPITPGNPSPYTSTSAFAINTHLLSPDLLKTQGLLTDTDLTTTPTFTDDHVTYKDALTYKDTLFTTITKRFQTTTNTTLHCHYNDFCTTNHHWLDDYATYQALTHHYQQPWTAWPNDIKDHTTQAITKIQTTLKDQITNEKILQYLATQQWNDLKTYCNNLNIQLIGDIPYYIDYYSADVWAHPDLFKLNPDKTPTVVSGVPPDYFSTNGQLWKNPIYRWNHPPTYTWWINRLAHNATLYDITRIDHFRGFTATYEIPATETTAKNGTWQPGPAQRFFNRLYQRHPNIQLIAEDLGYITSDVRELRDHFHIPGMKILQFAFFDDPTTNPYLPYNIDKNSIIYTGTHDNNTIKGWYDTEIDPGIRQRINDYTATNVTTDNIHWTFIRLASSSTADKTIIPMQDLLGLGPEARMNTPSHNTGNWTWRLTTHQLTPDLAHILHLITTTYGRTPPPIPQT